MKFSTTIISLGKNSLEFFEEDRLVILFGPEVKNDKDMEEYCIVINTPKITDDICVGDTLTVGDLSYSICAIGDHAMNTLRTLGHCTLNFDGSSEDILSGSIYLKNDTELPAFSENLAITIS